MILPVIPPNLRGMQAFVDQLAANGVQVDARVHQALGQSEVLATITHHDQPDLLALDATALREHVTRLTLLRSLEDGFKTVAWQVDEQIAAAVARIMRAEAGTYLDQLRPRFTAAAHTVHRACQAGLRPGATSAHAIAAGDDAVAIWRELPLAVSRLTTIAGLRIALSETLGVLPEPRPDRPVWAACFTTSMTAWKGQTETSQDLWLRLSGPEPVALLSPSDTAAIIRQATQRLAPQPMQDDDDDDDHVDQQHDDVDHDDDVDDDDLDQPDEPEVRQQRPRKRHPGIK